MHDETHKNSFSPSFGTANTLTTIELARSAGHRRALVGTAVLVALLGCTPMGGEAPAPVPADPIARAQKKSTLNAGFQENLVSCLSADSIRTRVGLPSSNCQSAYQFTPGMAQQIRDRNSQFPFSFQRAPVALSAMISLPLFDNFNREERVQQAQVAHDDAVYNVKAKDLALTADVTQAYRNLMTAIQTVRLQEQNAAMAKEELSFAEERYKVGASTFLDVTTSRDTYEQALVDRVTAVYDYHKAFAALENAVGHPLR